MKIAIPIFPDMSQVTPFSGSVPYRTVLYLGWWGNLGQFKNVSLNVHKVSVIFIIFLIEEKVPDQVLYQLYCSKYFKRFVKKYYLSQECSNVTGSRDLLLVLLFPNSLEAQLFFHFPTIFYIF